MIFLKIRIWVEKPLEVFQFFHSLRGHRGVSEGLNLNPNPNPNLNLDLNLFPHTFRFRKLKKSVTIHILSVALTQWPA